MFVKPILLSVFDKDKFENYKNFSPMFLQPKIDGVRTLYDGINFYSRNGNIFKSEILNHIYTTLPNGVILDGELVLPPKYTFQETVSAIKKYNNHSSSLIYYVFDLIDTNQPELLFSERFELLSSIIDNNSSHNIHTVITYNVDSIDTLNKLHLKNIDDYEYEGSVLRLNYKYEQDKRSKYILKIKDYEEKEFEIIDVKSGEGKYENLGIFVCKNDFGLEFGVNYKGAENFKYEILKNKFYYIGKYLTVKYQGFTDLNIPRFPIGINVRDKIIQG